MRMRIDDRELKELERDLKTFGSRAFPYATRNTINSAAFAAREEWQGEIRSAFITRNKYTERSVLVDRAKTLDVRRQSATVGSTADYMETQEFGGTERSDGGGNVALPTGYSANQEGKPTRTRLPTRANRMANIQLRQRYRKNGKNRAQRNRVTVLSAAKKREKFVYMDLGRRRGIFRVTGGVRRPRVKMVHDLTEKSYQIPKTPTLAPAIEAAQKKIPALYASSLRFQLRRLGLFKGG